MELLVAAGALVFASALVWKVLGHGKLRAYLKKVRGRAA